MIDLLFKAATSKRPPWYAESAVDSIVCEAITMIFRVPKLVILGINNVQTEKWDAVVDCFELLFSRPKWVEMLHGVWNMIEDEKPLEVKK